VVAAEAGDLEGADGFLSRALLRCPDEPGVVAEVAALRFRQGRMEEASQWGLRLLELDPGSEWAWELLGSVRYLTDDASGALHAWNRMGRPVVREVRIRGAGPGGGEATARTEGGRAGLTPGHILTPGGLALARRRLEALLAVADARVDYRPVPGGEVDVDGALFLAPLPPFSRTGLPAVALRALGGQAVLSVANPMGMLDRWTLRGVAEGSLGEGAIQGAVPAPLGPGALGWSVYHSQGRFPTPEGDPARLARTGVRSTHALWLRADTHLALSGGVDRWAGTESRAVAGAALFVHPPGGAISPAVSGEGCLPRGGSPAFGRGALE
jgi:hypothetical protein